jgi:hydrogenase/urease accessory protein HupE
MRNGNSRARKFFSSFLIPHSALLILFVTPILSLSHPSGTSKLDLFLKGDSLEALVDANRDDLFYSLFPTNDRPKMTKDELRNINERIAYYFQTRVMVDFDGRAAGPGKVLSWRKHGRDENRMMDSAELWDTTLVMRLGWKIPEATKKIDLQAKLFVELEVQPICHARLYWKDHVIREKWLEVDQPLEISVEPDSLAARLAAVTAPAGTPQGEQKTVSPPEEESVIKRFLLLGFTHIIPYGLDHILFVLGLFLFSTNLRPLFIQVTAFTLAHSITLGLSLLGIFSLPSRVVEPLIALSIAVVALENIFYRKLRPSRWMIVFGFGLVHGLGFAGALKELGLPEGQFFKTLISFNLGVECGQLTVIALASAATVWFWKRPGYFRYVVAPVSALIALVGLYWAVQRVILLS